MVGRVSQLERQTVYTKESKRSQGMAQEYQATVVSSFTKPVYCICKGIYQSLASHLTTCMGLFFVD